MANQNISELHKTYGFGAEKGADPSKAGSASWDARNAQRRLLAMKWPAGYRPTPAELLDRLAPDGEYSNADMLAVSRFMLATAMNEHSEKSISAMIDDVCGKLPNTNLNANVNGNIAQMMEEARKRVEAKKANATNR